MLWITGRDPQALRYAPAVRRAEALEQIERSMGRIGRAGSSVMAARRRAARAGVEVSAPGMGILGVLERGGPQRVSAVARRAGMVGTLASRELRALEDAGYVARGRDRSELPQGARRLLAHLEGVVVQLGDELPELPFHRGQPDQPPA